MKKILNIAIAAGIVCIAFASCKKDKGGNNNKLGSTFPQGVNNVITPDVLSKLKAAGATVNDGLTPPTVNGIYLLHPTYCAYDNSSDNAQGSIFDDYRFKFSSQNTSAFTISAEYKDIDSGTDFGADNSATYISGTGNLFTIYAQTTGTEDGISNTQLQLISGEISANGVKNLQLTVYLTSKGNDPDGELAAVGTTRIFNDQDGSSETQTTFSVAPKKGVNSVTSPEALKSLLSLSHNTAVKSN